MKNLDELLWKNFNAYGEIIALCSVGQVEEAIGVKRREVQRWIRKGWMPETLYVLLNDDYRDETRRLRYSREQVEGIVRIAKEERVCAPDFRNPADTEFGTKVKQLYKSIRDARNLHNE